MIFMLQCILEGIRAGRQGCLKLYSVPLLARAIVVDTKEGALAETGDLIIPIKKGIILQDEFYAEHQE